MESDDLPLETLLAKYEEGARLVKICQEKLAEAEVKIQQLEKNAAGEIKLKPFETDAEAEPLNPRNGSWMTVFGSTNQRF